MSKKGKKPRENDLAERYRAGDFDRDEMYVDDEETHQRFSNRNKNAQQDKIEKTALLRAALLAAAEESGAPVPDSLPIGRVLLVYSLFCEVESGGKMILCVTRKTLTKLTETQIVVGDMVRFRETPATDETSKAQGVIEQVLPRKTVLTRSDSFKGNTQHPIVANAGQMLIVAAILEPQVKWGLIDRMIVAAQSGGLSPIICLNKIDLARAELIAPASSDGVADDDETVDPRTALKHYEVMGLRIITTSVNKSIGLAELKDLLTNQETVLAGHSGVGKSSLIHAIAPNIDIRIGAISGFTGKGRHTTTSARRYELLDGGAVIDTPGVKLFGLWKMTPQRLAEFFPDVHGNTAPPWRVASYQRILKSL